MTDTPRTDFVAHESGDPEWNRFPNRFARMMSHACILERELAEAKLTIADHAQDCEALARYIKTTAPKYARDIADNWLGDEEKP